VMEKSPVGRTNEMDLTIIGAGLAGSEAAWQAAERGISVRLYEMRPEQMTPAHKTGDFAELVCSNSLRAAALENAVGLLKEEMRRLGSIIMACADAHRIPAGGALAVDREGFARAVTEAVTSHPRITVIRQEVDTIPNDTSVIIASGPLTSDRLTAAIKELTGAENLYFYDAAAPIVYADTLDMTKIFRASRYGRGDDYLNCPLGEAEYFAFREALVQAEKHPLAAFEEKILFEGCLPVEELAERGPMTLAYGPLKPVGLTDPRTGQQPYAVVQLRQDDKDGKLFNLVGFQTRLKWPEQQRVFRQIPGLETADFARYGVMHRNSYIEARKVLRPTLQMLAQPQIFFAGQITGVEGYVESAASGLVAGVNAARLLQGREPVVFPAETAHGALCRYITTSEAKSFQPMNITYGLLPSLPGRYQDKREKNRRCSEKALAALGAFSPGL